MRILIVKTSSLGDIVHCFCVARYIKKHMPHSYISWVVEKPYADLVERHPDVDQVHTIESKRWRKGFFQPSIWREIFVFKKQLQQQAYDVVIDLQGNIKSGLVTWLAVSNQKTGFQAPYVAEKPNQWFTYTRYLPPDNQNIRDDYLYLAHKALNLPIDSYFTLGSTLLRLTQDEEQLNKTLLANLPKLPRIMVFPGSAWQNKQLNENAFKHYLSGLNQTQSALFIFAWGSQEEKQMAERLADSVPHSMLLDRVNLPRLQNIMHHSNLVITMDSLPLHLASEAGVSTVSFFGPSSGQKYAPTGDRHLYIQGKCPYNIQFSKRCSKLRTCPSGACLRGNEKITIDLISSIH